MFARQANYQRPNSANKTYAQVFGYSRAYMTFSFFTHGLFSFLHHLHHRSR